MRTMTSGAAYGEDDDEDYGRMNIPERDEIEAMENYQVLWDMMDDYERACIRIETSLQYPGDLDRDWFFRARSALIRFRIALRQVEKRLKVLAKGRPGPSIVCVAPDES